MWGLEIKVKISFILSYSSASGKEFLTSSVIRVYVTVK